jgi:hypothetical protein
MSTPVALKARSPAAKLLPRPVKLISNASGDDEDESPPPTPQHIKSPSGVKSGRVTPKQQSASRRKNTPQQSVPSSINRQNKECRVLSAASAITPQKLFQAKHVPISSVCMLVSTNNETTGTSAFEFPSDITSAKKSPLSTGKRCKTDRDNTSTTPPSKLQRGLKTPERASQIVRIPKTDPLHHQHEKEHSTVSRRGRPPRSASSCQIAPTATTAITPPTKRKTPRKSQVPTSSSDVQTSLNESSNRSSEAKSVKGSSSLKKGTRRKTQHIEEDEDWKQRSGETQRSLRSYFSDIDVLPL